MAGGSKVDENGELKNGNLIKGPTGLKAHLLKQEDQFLRNLAGKTLAYALGRSLEYYDLHLINQSLVNMKAEGYTFSSLATSIILSDQFLYRRGSHE